MLGRVDHGDEQRLRAHIQVLFDQCHVGLYGAHHRLHRIRRKRPQLVEHGARIVGAMLPIQQQPVKAAASQGFGYAGDRKSTRLKSSH